MKHLGSSNTYTQVDPFPGLTPQIFTPSGDSASNEPIHVLSESQHEIAPAILKNANEI